MIREFLKNNLLLSDGAMGTFYSELTGDSTTRVEVSNVTQPETVLNIHRKYIDAGSKLLRSNTFSANTHSLNITEIELKNIISSAWSIAKQAVGNKNIFIAGDIGPIPVIGTDGEQISDESILNEYFFIVDCFLELGCSIFNFETFSSTDYLLDVVNYIKKKSDQSFIMLQFAVDKYGYTRKGINLEALKKFSESLNIDLVGLNCGSGPTHLVNHIDGFQTAYANAGYPEIVNNRTVFNSSPKYYADVISSIVSDVKIVGGCCGTTPEHIQAINDLLNGRDLKESNKNEIETTSDYESRDKRTDLIIAVELDPPFRPDLTKILASGKVMKNLGVDYITLADSPSGRMRLNPITVAARLKRDLGVNVMPHICCRDRNLIALKSDILAAHTEGIRDILIVTGDPIPLEERDEVRKVFNCNSVSLMKQVEYFNQTLLNDETFNIGGALNLSSKKLDVQVAKMNKKIEAGAKMFLTQPLYETRSIDFLHNIKKDDDVKILAGILPIVTYKNAMFLNNEFPGISIPNSMISRFKIDMSREEAEELGINISVEIVNRLKGFVDGFYFMTPFNRTNMISEIINRAELR